VPDWVVRRADQLELVDSSADQLRRRMLHGNIYPESKVPTPWPGSSRTRTSWRCASSHCVSWPTRRRGALALPRVEAAPVGVGDRRAHHGGRDRRPGSDGVIRRAARMAARMKGDLHVIHVQSDEHSVPRRSSRSASSSGCGRCLARGARGRPGAHGGQVSPRPPDHPDRGGATRRSRFEEGEPGVRCAQDPPLRRRVGNRRACDRAAHSPRLTGPSD